MTITSNIWGWSTTAADNDDVDSTINWAEGMDPGAVNNSGRAMMAATKRLANVLSGNVTVGGTANAITITTGQSIESAQQALGFRFAFKATGTNTGATTINVDTNGAVAVKRVNGDALSAGDIVSGGIYDVAHNGTNYTLVGAGAGAGTYSTLSGDNTFTGTNIFQGNTTIGDGSGDTVVIKGTTVNSFVSGLFSSANTSAFYTAAGTVPVANGGTGATSAAAGARALLNGLGTTKGHILWYNGSNWTVLAPATGTPGYQLTVADSGGTIAWGPSPSDYRLKEDIQEIKDAGSIIDGLRPVTFRWNCGDRLEAAGFIAHEAADLLPSSAVSGAGKGAVGDDGNMIYQGLDKTQIIAYLVAEVQSLRRRVAARGM